MAFPGVPSGRGQFPRLQLRGSAGFTPASLSSPSGKDARSEEDYKEQEQPCERMYWLGVGEVKCESSFARWTAEDSHSLFVFF